MTRLGDLVTRDANAFFHQHGSSPCVGALRFARGMWLEDADGKCFIDLHGNSCHHVGHAHPRIVAALKQQLDELCFSPRRFTNRAATELAERLTGRFRNGGSRLLFMPGGSEAIETAIRLACVATGRSGIIALEGSYHGHGMGSLSLSESALDDRLPHRIPGVFHLPPYWDEVQGGGDQMVDALARCLAANSGRIACLVAEPMRSNCHVPPPDLWPRVANLCSIHGVKLIFDEIPSGLGRTGRFFAYEHFDVQPDVVVLGKALGGGMLPLAAVVGDARMNMAPELAIGHYTHEKNPLAAAVGLATLDIIESDGLIEKAAQHGDRLHQLLHDQIVGPFRLVLRGLGLFRALSFQGPTVGGDALISAARACGISTTAKDQTSIGMSPPLAINDSDVIEISERIKMIPDQLSRR